ncbi:metallophosphoesterase [Gottfriedia luciferensis]|uniref:metallophosphoesterase n=1 Tax=Gottfriedia luciferensis TaxID=178774 RepID=UPI0013025746|nr:metallophosphoesterase [Gottfriedia luciferensis]
MNKRILLNIILVTSFFLLINFYIGFHGWMYISALLAKWANPTVRSIYWILFWFISFSYIFSRVFKKRLPNPLFKRLHQVGAYWLAIFYYLIFFIIASDFIGLVIKITTNLKSNKIILILGTIVLLSIIFLISKGRKSALNTQIIHYDLNVDKSIDKFKELSIVLVSDLHLSTLVTNKRLEFLVAEINKLSPDLVLIAGDIIDEDITPFVEENMIETFKKLKPKIGTYAVPGNHDYYGGHLDLLVKHLKEADIHILLDEKELVEDSFYIIGRKDLASKNRLELDDLLEGIDHSKPIILLDHQPYHLEIPTQLGVDIQVSGHTHRGQFMPNHLITRRLYEVDWGYLQKNNSHFVVSSGFGTWGPPIRTGNPSEIVTIKVSFTK